MAILKNRQFAIFAMILLIAAGTLIGSHNDLVGMRSKASDIFILGARGDGIGIQGDLRERGDVAHNMVSLALKYLPASNAVIENVLLAGETMSKASTVKEKAAADRKLATAVRDLYDVLSSMELSEQDAKYPQRLYTDFRSRGDTISHDPYNGAAADFNRTLSAFPAGLLGKLTGVRPLELFE